MYLIRRVPKPLNMHIEEHCSAAFTKATKFDRKSAKLSMLGHGHALVVHGWHMAVRGMQQNIWLRVYLRTCEGGAP